MVKTIRIDEKTHSKVFAIKTKLQKETGLCIPMEHVLELLVKTYKGKN